MRKTSAVGVSALSLFEFVCQHEECVAAFRNMTHTLRYTGTAFRMNVFTKPIERYCHIDTHTHTNTHHTHTHTNTHTYTHTQTHKHTHKHIHTHTHKTHTNTHTHIHTHTHTHTHAAH